MRTEILERNKTSEVNSQVEMKNPADCETPVVIAQSLTIAKRFHSMIAYFEANKKWIIELRKRFGVSQGQPGQTLNIEGNDLLWKDFVTNYFHVTPRWMNELLSINEKPETNPKAIEDKPLYRRGFEAGRRSVEGAAEIDRKIAKIAENEKEIAELKTKLRAAKTLGYKNMLSKLIEAVISENAGLPATPAARLAQNFRQQMVELDKSMASAPPASAVTQKKQSRLTQAARTFSETA
jgi:hypothetical protein